MKQFNWRILFLLSYLLVLTACASLSPNQRSTPQQLVAPTVRYADISNDWPVNIENLPAVAQVPEVIERPVPLRELSEIAKVTLSQREITCMANAVYFEARGEGELGMRAVGFVVLNRMGHYKYPNTACGVVYQRSGRGCQFSWVCDGKPDTIRQRALYQQAEQIALEVLTRSVENPVDNSLFFRHHSIARNLKSQRMVSRIGLHRFYAAI